MRDQGAKHFRRFLANVRIVQRFLEPLDLLGINVGSGLVTTALPSVKGRLIR